MYRPAALVAVFGRETLVCFGLFFTQFLGKAQPFKVVIKAVKSEGFAALHRKEAS
jgi:hypothetical protein